MYTPSNKQMQRWAQQACAQCEQKGSIDIAVLNEQQMAQLNLNFRGRENATNVLAFPFANPPGAEWPILGDMALCAEVINQQAERLEIEPRDYWARIVVHGALHLCGLDHQTQEQEQQMLRLERLAMQALNIAGIHL